MVASSGFPPLPAPRVGEATRRDRAEHHESTVELPPSLRHPRAHRLRGGLAYVTANPGVSNREIAAAIGIASHTQASALLARLARMGLLEKRAGLPGRPNAWSASERGRQAVHVLEREPTVTP